MPDEIIAQKKPDGGCAFPKPIGNNGAPNYEDREVSSEEYGMSLRDYFAAKAMHAEIVTTFSDATPAAASAFIASAAGENRTVEQHLAFNAYLIADAMIAERAK